VKLTDAGRQLALHVLRRHRLVELFLVRVVGLDWSEVHDEAEELEHVISEKVLEKIDVLLGHPTVDPHGDPIPTAGGEVAEGDGMTLMTCAVGEWVEVTRVLDQEGRFLKFVEESGLTPGSRVRVMERNVEAESMVVERGSGEVTLSLGVGGKFVVRAN
jgi:DtxR family Mn-dependent transcriptional regulator